MLLEVLEVPSLMDTCLRNGSFDDALDLRAFVSKTALLHPNLPVQLTSGLSSCLKLDTQAWPETVQIQAPSHSCFIHVVTADLTLEHCLTTPSCGAPWSGGPKAGEGDGGHQRGDAGGAAGPAARQHPAARVPARGGPPAQAGPLLGGQTAPDVSLILPDTYCPARAVHAPRICV